MTSYNVTGEVHLNLTEKRADHWLESLAEFHPSIGRSGRGFAEIIITFDAPGLDVAALQGRNILRGAVGSGVEFDSIHVMPTTVFDEYTDLIQPTEAIPDLVGVHEAAELLDCSRQYVLRLIGDRTLHGKKVGNSMVMLRSAVERLAARTSTKAPA